jgi:hypothetical protein
MPSVTRPAPRTNDQSQLPTPGVRTLITFLLFVHLFMLFAAIVSNEAPSELEQRLRNVPGLRPYVQLLAMDLPYTYHLTYGPTDGPPGETFDADARHWIEVELNLPGGKQQKVELPAAGSAAGQMQRRYTNLARRACGLAESTTYASMIPFAVSSALVHQTGATGGTVRLWQQKLPARPPYRTVAEQPRALFEAAILVSGGKIQLFKKESATDSAPAAQAK